LDGVHTWAAGSKSAPLRDRRVASDAGREVKKCNEIETEILVIVDGRPMGDAAQ